MTWYEHVEQKRTLLIGGMITICVAALAVAARRKPASFDSYWHLQTGLDWINQGLSPWVDHFSFTFSGEAIGSQPFMFQALLAWLVSSFGLEPGYQIYKLVGFFLAFGLVTLFLRKLKAPAVVYCMVLPLFVLLVELRAVVRPELLAYSLSIVAVMLYHRARSTITAGNVLPMALLLLFWTNYHTAILGYIVFFGFFVDSALLQIKTRAGLATWMKWFSWGLLLLVAGSLHKGFQIPVIGAFGFAPEWKEFIPEYQPATLFKGVIAMYALILVVAATLALAAWKQRFGYLVVTLILTYFSVQMSRLVTPGGIIILCIFAALISEVDLKKAIRRQGTLARSMIGSGVLFVVLASLYSSVTFARLFMEQNDTLAQIRPESTVRYMKGANLSGRIFNEYGIGGYLIYTLSPESKVYIDGRTNVLYPVEHYRRFLDARNNPEILREEIEKHDINLAILENDQRAYSVMHEAGALGLDFSERTYSLFTRDNPSFPLTGKLLGNPACWNARDAETLAAEFSSAMLKLPANSSLLPRLGLMFNYSEAPDPRAFIVKLRESPISDALQLRFAAYQALSLGLFQVSADLFERIAVWDHREFLAAALANVRLERWREAERIIESVTMVRWPHVTENDVILQYRLVETIRRNGPLEHIPADYADGLRERAENLGEPAGSLDLDVGLLCPD